MEKSWILCALILPLAGCAERAEMAPGAGGEQTGPLTLTYRLAQQEPLQYRIHVTGESTAAYRQSGQAQEDQTAPQDGSAGQSTRSVRAQFESEMVVRQSVMPMNGATGDQSAATEPPLQEPSDPSSPGQRPMTDPATEGRPGEAPTMDPDVENRAGEAPAGGAEQFQLSQRVQNWTATVRLPEGMTPNEYTARYGNGEMNIEAGGNPFPMPPRYREMVTQALQQPVVAIVTPKGEVREVRWPVPSALAMRSPGATARPGTQFQSMASNSLGALNLWFGMVRLPDRPVTVGETWSANERMPVQFGQSAGSQYHMQRDAQYTLRDVTGTSGQRQAVIAVTETLRLFPGTAGTASTEQTPVLLQTRTGTVNFNVDAGRIDSANQEFNVSWDQGTRSNPTRTQTRTMTTGGQAQGTIRVEHAAGDSTNMPQSTPPQPETPAGQ